MKTILKFLIVAGLFCVSSAKAIAQTTSTVHFDTQSTHQRITGFGGFVCSPQFGYNHMSEAEIKKVWGPTSTLGCNIMRLYLPIGESSWSQSLATAKLAKKLGITIFASPWGQPKEWKTNNSVDGKNENGVVGSLKKENWPDYAAYLEKYVQYLRKNGVELDAISIQNEPDWTPTYAGCKWTTSEMAEFVKTYGRQISCKIITPESIGCSDGYANDLNKTDVLDCFDIYGGHQYGGIGSAYKNLAKKGKEIWMTEYLINWNENQPTNRNFDFSKDFFNFFTAINTCMLGDFNAWVHYASKRFYAMLGDGQNGTSNGTITKRGYVMAHFAKFVTGMTRIDATFGGGLEGSAYLSQTGDTIVAVMANASDNAIDLTFDLPFYTQQGELRTTGKSQNFTKTELTPETETCRPMASVAAQSVATVMFVKSRDRQPSDMTGSMSYFERSLLDDMKTTKSSFGTSYKLSNKTGKKFDSDNPLISSRKTTANGYIELDENYTQLVMQIKKVTTTGSLTAGKPTLYYVNAKGEVATHEYNRLDMSQGENFELVFDLSSATLPDGCIGLLSLTCDNTYSHLTINFGDVYLTSGNMTYAGTLSGAYVADDSYVLDFSTDPCCTSIDMTAVTGLPATLPWLEQSNRVVYVSGDSELSGSNVVKDGVCASLVIDERFGPFHPAQAFTATEASYTCEVNGQHILQLPFQAAVPEGINVFTLTDDLTPVAATIVPANRPLLVEGQGVVTFLGSGEVSYASCPLSDDVLPIATPTTIQNVRVSASDQPIYDLHGKRVDASHRGVIIRNGKKYLIQ
jgi:glucuronoarabinoxylan endo-1,4-beta-xylanase